MPLDLGKGIFNLNYEREQLSDRDTMRSPKGQWQSQRIEFITEQYLQGKSSKLILFVLSHLSFALD
ncbi:MAG: hypothetical protein V7K77_32820 [Nostoc sp.]|uniref:hypothetical protein n=1 Tax=Nostoc sp. TaxID=1180 RepID=UPI002FFBDBD8